jgi:hypothetical protein
MATMVIDPKAIAQLLGMKERVKLLDQSGHTLGYFDPPMSVRVPDHITKAEIDRREKESGGLTTAEAITFLRRQKGL